MGAVGFATRERGKDAQEAFRRAHDEAAWEHGHGGYTGTIAEKWGFVMARGFAGSGLTPDQYAALIASAHPDDYGEDDSDDLIYAWTWDAPARKEVRGAPLTDDQVADKRAWDDKWGPALCIPTGVEGEYLFCGLASL